MSNKKYINFIQDVIKNMPITSKVMNPIQTGLTGSD